MKNIKIIINCDTCATDISPHKTSYPRADILEVKCINVAINNGFIYGIFQRPILENDLYFCSIECMTKYGLSNKENKDENAKLD